MALNDVWRRIGDEVGFYYEENFEQVPALPGVYAWFYPLRLLSSRPDALENFAADVQVLLNYDAATRGPASAEALLGLAWCSWTVRASRVPRAVQLSGALAEAWKQVSEDETLFTEFQQALLKASIFMPPLYVGKADNLNVRCAQHRKGGDDANNFHNRFETFARDHNLRLRTVEHLVFACVRTGAPADEDKAQHSPSPTHELLEAIMKSLCSPAYGRR